jgi:epoxyqueuosine reductase
MLDASLREARLSAHGFIGEAALRESCSLLPTELASRLGLDRSRGAIAAALSYGEGSAIGEIAGVDFSAYPGPLARIARFARANWYAELGARLREAAALIRARLHEKGLDPGPVRDWRCFSNSRLPEKRLALEAGLGRLGRDGLVMLPVPGSAVVLGVLLLPFGVEDLTAAAASSSSALDPSCDGCRECVAACPTGALSDGSGSEFTRELCLQHWSSIPGSLPLSIEATWGDRLYGCDSCQQACPRYRPDASAKTDRGLLGPGLPASWLVSAPDGEIRSTLKRSALGMGWISIDALRRNALLALHGGI